MQVNDLGMLYIKFCFIIANYLDESNSFDVMFRLSNSNEICMEFFGAFIVSYCLWLSQSLNDSQKKQVQEIEKRLKEKLKNEQYVNIRIIEKL